MAELMVIAFFSKKYFSVLNAAAVVSKHIKKSQLVDMRSLQY